MCEVYKRIKTEREQLGLTQEELGKKLNVVRSTISNWEAGRKTPDPKMLNQLANIFNCSMDYLWGRTDFRTATVIQSEINGHNVEIDMNNEYFKKCTPDDIRQILKDIEDSGFDIVKLINN